MNTYNSFNELAVANGSVEPSPLSVFNPEQAVENLDIVSEPSPPNPGDNNPPKIPQWGRTLTERVANLERNMATKADIARIEQLIQQR